MTTTVKSRQANNCPIYLLLRMDPNKEKLYCHCFFNFVLERAGGGGTNSGRQIARATKIVHGGA